MSMTDKPNWDDVPSLELEIDWDFVPESSLGKRSYVRVTKRDLYRLFQKREYPISIRNGGLSIDGTLEDISEGGLSMRSDKELLKGQEVNIDLSLGDKTIIASGIIRLVRKIDGEFFVGIEFSALTKKVKKYIKNMYPSAKVLR